jgi:hypothetical protein
MTILVTFLLTFAVLLAVIGGMAIGVMNGRAPIAGSCGGLNSGKCELCTGNGNCKREARQ